MTDGRVGWDGCRRGGGRRVMKRDGLPETGRLPRPFQLANTSISTSSRMPKMAVIRAKKVAK